MHCSSRGPDGSSRPPRASLKSANTGAWEHRKWVSSRLVATGNTVVLVEHDLDAIAAADWVIDLGPGGGDAGGTVVATGPPAEIAKAMGVQPRPISLGGSNVPEPDVPTGRCRRSSSTCLG